jgi:hypothetical protein
MAQFPAEEIEPVHVDELLLLIERAFEQKMITEELYPDRSGIKKIMMREARSAWPAFHAELQSWQTSYSEGEQSYIENIAKTPLGLEKIDAAAFLAFAAIWHAMKLVKLSLESKGIYVNHKPTATKRFRQEFQDLQDSEVITDLQNDWDNWHSRTLAFQEAAARADKLVKLSAGLNAVI